MTHFNFKQFKIAHGPPALKVTTDACLLGALANPGHAKHILDLGAGTGLLSLMLAQKASGNATITSVEINGSAFNLLKENVDNNPFPIKINAVEGNVFNFYPGKPAEFIICNPPFFSGLSRPGKHDLNLAIHTINGLQDLKRWILRCGELLSPGGRLFMLLPWEKNNSFIDLFPEAGLAIEKVNTIAHSARHKPNRIVVEAIKGFGTAPLQQEEILIYDENGKYTPEYAQLMKPYLQDSPLFPVLD